MDPFMHLLLPTLFLLALRLDPKRVLLLAPLAVLPDFDALFGLHRALGHSFIPILVLPMALLVYAKYRRPEWFQAAVLVQFFLASHVVLDLGGVAFLWPFVKEQFYFDPGITFSADGGFHMDFTLDYGLRPLADMGTTSFLSDTGFALILLGLLAAVIFRPQARAALRTTLDAVKGLFARVHR